MQILFIHQNFPGQFKHLAPALVGQGHQVTAMTLQPNPPATWQGVRLAPYGVDLQRELQRLARGVSFPEGTVILRDGQ